MYRVVPRHLLKLARTRLYSTIVTPAHLDALENWIASPSKLVLSDIFSVERLSDLFVTLPTRDGVQRPYQGPQELQPLGHGHHLIFFHPRIPESLLRTDGTDPDFCPPQPFTRRMWAGGRFEWNTANPLLVGSRATATGTVASVSKKAFDKGKPMVFVDQKISVSMEGASEPSVTEIRSHVYMPPVASFTVGDLPRAPDFSFTYQPSLTTLFRFSALTFNAHHIHLDKDFTQIYEGYPERLVHGPLTALMLLETAVLNNPGLKLKSFDYRATNPMVVNRKVSIHGAWINQSRATLWCADENGVVGMVGSIEKAS
ncbi:hypothetical protein AX17_003336 [Amanita inopinata Kibby_2008]|nr:hypothetical protein AX17_003336 [Amanita inopinata Kibby_2008]